MGTAAEDPTLADCQQEVCNGNGGSMSVADDTDTPSDVTVCTTDSCLNGIPTFTPVALGNACSEGSGTVCDGAGACTLANGAVCVQGVECVSGNCVDGVCCNTACTDTCQACNVAGNVGTCLYVPFGQNDADTCSGATESCDGAGACNKEVGQACTMNSACASNSCAGGICTGQSCNGLAATCGPSSNESCCVSSVVVGGTYNRSNDAMYTATVSDFRLDRFEITVGRFRKFVEAYPGNQPAAGAGAHPLIPGSGWDAAWNASLPANQLALKTAVKCDGTFQTWTDTAGANENLPMTCINWYESFAFCAWDGGRLPTEAEWNYAAAGGDQQRQYPWGATVPDASYAVYECLGDGSAAGNCVFADILTGGSKSPKGDGRWGQASLGGSMLEWNLDWHKTPYKNPCVNCTNETQSTNKVIRGGSWNSDASVLLSSTRASFNPTYHNAVIGARCSRTP